MYAAGCAVPSAIKVNQREYRTSAEVRTGCRDAPQVATQRAGLRSADTRWALGHRNVHFYLLCGQTHRKERPVELLGQPTINLLFCAYLKI